MAEFEKAVARLEAARVARELDRRPFDALQLGRDAMTGATFQAGARVRDRVTGGYGNVVATRFLIEITPAPGGGGAGDSGRTAR